MQDSRPNVKDFSPQALRERFVAEGFEAYRADQVAAWLYARGVEDLERMTDLSAALREHLRAQWSWRALEVEEIQRSRDGTLKGRLRTADGFAIESVLIPEPKRTTLCISTQVGCSLACSFCATGAMGFSRNLSTAEIVDQLCRMREFLEPEQRVTNVVFMGMGEPLLNLPRVLEAIRILMHPKAFALAGRRITVSTAGVVPQMAPLLQAAKVNLAVSLHAASDALRDVLVPLNRRFPLEVLFQTLRALPQVTARWPIFFEYTLMDGVNDDVEEAQRLVRLLRGLPCKLNLIPLNPHADAAYRPSSPERIDRFVAETVRGGLTVTLRRNRGGDIAAACGQLALREAQRAQ